MKTKSKNVGKRFAGAMLLGSFLFHVGCGGGSSSNGSGENPGAQQSTGNNVGGVDVESVVRFSEDGTIEDLRELSEDLVFEDLEISGKLDLGSGEDIKLSARNITITGDGAMISNSCIYPRAKVEIAVSDKVVINGPIDLSGEHGYSCSCDAGPGGSLFINAKNMYVNADISVEGRLGGIRGGNNGFGATFGCDGGDSGLIRLTANTVEIGEEVRLHATKGSGTTGWAFGSPTYGSDGSVGSISLEVSEELTMAKGSEITTDGELKISPALTESDPLLSTTIAGQLNYDTLLQAVDSDPVVIESIEPIENMSVNIAQATPIKIRIHDPGSSLGIYGVEISGASELEWCSNASCETLDSTKLSYSYTDLAIEDGVVTFMLDELFKNAYFGDNGLVSRLPDFPSPGTLKFEVKDNAGYFSTVLANFSVDFIPEPIAPAVKVVYTDYDHKAHGLALLEDGTVWAWGDNKSAQLGTTRYVCAIYWTRAI